nr:hypothetical protein [uncultured Mediterranean phage uvMED]
MTRQQRIEAAEKRIEELKNLLMNGLKNYEVHT